MFTTVYSGMLTHVYSCWHNMVIPCYLWLQMLTYVYSLNLFTFVYPCLLVFTSVYLCLPLFIFVYLCLLVLTYVCRCLLLQVYIRWHMFTYVSYIYPFFCVDVSLHNYDYPCYECLPLFNRVYLRFPLFTHLYLCLPLFTRVYMYFLVFCLCLPLLIMFACIPPFTSAMLPMFTHFYSCLHSSHLFTYDYPCLLVFTYVYNCSTNFTPVYSSLPMFNSI